MKFLKFADIETSLRDKIKSWLDFGAHFAMSLELLALLTKSIFLEPVDGI